MSLHWFVFFQLMTNDLRKKKNFSFSRHFPFMKSKDQSDSEDAFNVEPIERVSTNLVHVKVFLM